MPEELREEINQIFDEAQALASELADSPLEQLPWISERLQASVLRPLGQILSTASAGDGRSKPQPDTTAPADRLIRLATAATRVRSRAGAPAGLVEATAALQHIGLAAATLDGTDTAAAVSAQLGQLQANQSPGITVSADGPYLVTNLANLSNHLGERLSVRPQMALCRCGGSSLKPLCDGTHARIGFSGAKDPGRVPDRRDTYRGQQVSIFDNRGICAHSGFCTDRLASVFHAAGDPFVSPSGGRMDEIIRAVQSCPSGALSFAIDDREAREYVDQQGRSPDIEVSKDGPYRITGGIPLQDEEDAPVTRAAGSSLEHYSLCRCGQSQNKPFCSGRHWYVGFQDPPLSDKPTLFEWAGGLPALTRLTRRVFETLVADDDLLAPLFADMDPVLPSLTAAWLANAFGGAGDLADEDAATHTAESLFGGDGMTEETRRRLVALFERSANEVGLPSDAEFRSAFVSFLEWASRRAAGVLWDWIPAGGPPRVDRAEPAAEPVPVDLPGPDEPVFFDQHIKQLFRPSDRDAMLWAFDLASYDNVVANAEGILQRLRAGSMPCDGPWPAERVDVFSRWVDAGTPMSPDSPRETVADQTPAQSAAGSDQEPIGGRLGSLVQLRSASPVGDRPVVIEHREPLIYMLCSAAELEHALMCEYLFAAFTLKRSVDEGITQEQLAAIERWRSTLLLVAKQEMLHLAINCNLVNSLGASPHLSRPNLPQPAKHYPPGVILTLLPFGEQALRHFLYLERPEGMDFDDAEGLAAIEGAAPIMREEEIAPHLQEFATVGHLYRSIEEGFRHLADKLGEDNLFVTSATEQVTGELFGWPQLQPVTSVDGAVRAIETLVEQGEGPRGDWRNAHFGRFLKVLDEYTAMQAANPALEVARPVLPALVRPPESGEAAELITDPDTAGIADLGNVAYEVLLQLLYRLLSRVDETPDEMKTLSDVAVGLMFDVIEPLAELLTTLPVGPEHPGRTAGPSFELFYQPDYLLPHRQAAWRIMAEHLADASQLCTQHETVRSRLQPVADALTRHADTLRAGAGD